MAEDIGDGTLLQTAQEGERNLHGLFDQVIFFFYVKIT